MTRKWCGSLIASNGPLTTLWMMYPKNNASTRIFTFGVGADLNAALMEQLALDGAGTAHFVRPEEDVERVVSVVAQRLSRPVATNLRVRATGVQLRAIQPAGRLDLFAGHRAKLLGDNHTLLV